MALEYVAFGTDQVTSAMKGACFLKAVGFALGDTQIGLLLYCKLHDEPNRFILRDGDGLKNAGALIAGVTANGRHVWGEAALRAAVANGEAAIRAADEQAGW